MIPRNHIELLSPAKDAECAIAAILAGADAVYMGAQNFGARSAAGNSYDDIARVCDFAHVYGARVYIALNTIFTDAELPLAREAAHKVCECGADAIIVQDMGLAAQSLPAIPIHASTQCHTTTSDKAKFLENAGFDTIVLARELTLAEISEISKSVKARIECFIHGALCVSYSGQCYLSHAIGGRSANRGQCAQPCRLAYELLDANGHIVAPSAHYLSLKDMNRSAAIGEMLDAGVSSFKIEGRLKNVDYVKNITAHYRKILDAEIAKRGLRRSSFGQSSHSFTANPHKSFNRGFCEYFLRGKNEKIESFKTPKSRGEFIGTATRTTKNGFVLSEPNLTNGDGIFIENPNGESFGTNVQRAEATNIICGADCPKILENAKIWRNKDIVFESQISETPKRAMPVKIKISEDAQNWIFKFTHIESDISAEEIFSKSSYEIAQNFERAKEQISQNMSKLGASKFSLGSLEFNAVQAPFLKASEINELRRNICEKLETAIKSAHETKRKISQKIPETQHDFDKSAIAQDYRANVLNDTAKNFYTQRGITISEKAPETGMPNDARELMLTRHCILHELNMCKKDGKFPKNLTEPMQIKHPDITLKIEFKCRECKMGLFKS